MRRSTSASCPMPARARRSSSRPVPPTAASAPRKVPRSRSPPGRRSARCWRSWPTPRPRSPSATTARSRGRGSSTGSSTRASGCPRRCPSSRRSSRPTGAPGRSRSRPSTRPRTRPSTTGRPTSRSRTAPGRRSRPRSANVKLKTFAFTDYGLPDSYAVVLVCNDDWLAAHGDVARRFLAATVAGFEQAATDPDGAAAKLIAANPGVFDANLKLPLDSARYLAEHQLYGPPGSVGRQTDGQWAAFSGFLFDTGLLAGPDGKPLAARPDFSTYFTNDFLP